MGGLREASLLVVCKRVCARLSVRAMTLVEERDLRVVGTPRDGEMNYGVFSTTGANCDVEAGGPGSGVDLLYPWLMVAQDDGYYLRRGERSSVESFVWMRVSEGALGKHRTSITQMPETKPTTTSCVLTTKPIESAEKGEDVSCFADDSCDCFMAALFRNLGHSELISKRSQDNNASDCHFSHPSRANQWNPRKQDG